MSFDKIQFKITVPTGTLFFDSEKPIREGNVSDRVYSEFIHKKFTFTLTNSGKIESITGLDSLSQKIISSLNLKNKMLEIQLLQNFRDMFGEKALKGNFEMLTYFFPKKSVAINDSWFNIVDLSAIIPSKMENTWKLTAYDQKSATINGYSDIESLDHQPSVKINGMPIKYDVSGNQTCDIKINSKTGWILSSHTQSHIEGKIIIGKNPHAPKGLNIPIDFKTITEISSL